MAIYPRESPQSGEGFGGSGVVCPALPSDHYLYAFVILYSF